MASISIRLSLNYGNRCVFDNFEFSVDSQKLVCLLGRSGVGKSTLLRFIAGLLPPDSVHGTVSASDGLSLEGRIAWMAQQDLLFPWLNVIDNVTIGSRLRGKQDAAVRMNAKKLLQDVHLQGVEHHYPHQLSGGMRHRVALARTLIEARPFNLLDEPFSGLDAITRVQLQDLACRLLGNTTTLLVTHDPLEALRMADVIYVLYGSPVKAGEPFKPHGKAPRQINNVQTSDAYSKLCEQLTGMQT